MTLAERPNVLSIRPKRNAVGGGGMALRRLLPVRHVRPKQQRSLDPAVGPIQHRLPQRNLVAFRVHPVDRLLAGFACNNRQSCKKADSYTV